MNIGETKKEFEKDCRTEYEVLEVKKLHLNVNQIMVNIKETIITFGYSYRTIIAFNLLGYTLRTEENFSVSTQKHKGQVLSGIDGVLIDLPKGLFDFILNTILDGDNITSEGIVNFLSESSLRVVKVNSFKEKNALDFLRNYMFFDEYNFLKEIKDVIKSRAWTVGTVQVFYSGGDMDSFEVLNDGYKFGDRVYRNLSFLNKLNLNNIVEVH